MISKNYFDDIKTFREHFHKHPELSNNESCTANYIKSILEVNQIEYYDNIGGFGILAVIKGDKPGKTIAIRADMDALPVQESNNVRYRSTVDGVMHACGHDLHMATLLTVLKYFKNNSSSLKGILLGVFQPAEEKIPGGAKAMLNEGVFNKYTPDFILAIHAAPDLISGTIGLTEKYGWAAADEIIINVKGKGGHGALLHSVNDPIIAAAHLLIAIEQISSRLLKAGEVSVLSFGSIQGGSAPNIIPDNVIITGTFRSFNEEWRNTVHEKLKAICFGTGLAFNVEIDIEINRGYPALYNNPTLTRDIATKTIELFGENSLVFSSPRMTSEDFSYFSEKFPSCMIRLGTSNADGRFTKPLHSSNFDIDEYSYEFALKLLIGLLLKFN